LFSTDGWDHNSHYYNFLLKHIPAQCGNALEIGCGTGAFARLLAKRADHVLALDLSPQMIHFARERSKQYPNIDFQATDALSWEFPQEQFDCILSIATLHHLPMERMLSKMKAALKINGTLLILDIFKERLSDMYADLFAIPVNLVLKYLKTGRVKEPLEVRKAWAEHGQRDSYLTLPQIRRMCAAMLPGAQVRRHLLWRYSIIWKKPPLTQ
jgi:ubiquinone/menaquinone biosynthesis C-methylase UbiE